jgi:probable HAF family extracellular repeat protein
MKQYVQLAVPLLIAAACTGGDQRSPTAPELGPTSARQTRPSISVTNLPSLGGGSIARAINDDQVIVGSSNGLPVKWTLDTSGQWAVSPLQSTAGAAEDITELGVIVGSSGGSVTLWSAGATETIGPGYPVAMNESEVVVGFNYPAGGGNAARAWTRSGTVWVEHTLPMQAGFTGGLNEPRDINDDGTIVGFAADVGGVTHAVKWVLNTTGEWDPPVILDDVAATHYSGALAIVGPDIVGEILRCFLCNTGHDPYHWSLTGQGIGSLGTETAYAEGLNTQRYIVGSFYGRAGLRAFVWTPANPIIQDLGIVNGYRTTHAYDINSPKGARTTSQAVGQGISARGKSIAILWTVP